jgi:hypothetical protein
MTSVTLITRLKISRVGDWVWSSLLPHGMLFDIITCNARASIIVFFSYVVPFTLHESFLRAGPEFEVAL